MRISGNTLGRLALATALLATAVPASATIVQATFNDLNAGSLNGQAGGTGFTGNWLGSSGIPRVVATDLVAPPSTNFALTQSGNPRSVDEAGSAANQNIDRQRSRALTTPLTGEIWFSFLVNSTGSAIEVAGIGLNNPASNATFNDFPSLLAVGSDLVYDSNRANRTTATREYEVRATGVIPSTGDSLVLGRIIIDPTGALPSQLIAWVNPDLNNMPAPQLVTYGLESLNTAFTAWNPVTSISSIAVGGSASSTTSGGGVDLLTMSDSPTALFDVTGVSGIVVPEPTSAVFVGGLVTTLVRRSRRHSRD